MLALFTDIWLPIGQGSGLLLEFSKSIKPSMKSFALLNVFPHLFLRIVA